MLFSHFSQERSLVRQFSTTRSRKLSAPRIFDYPIFLRLEMMLISLNSYISQRQAFCYAELLFTVSRYLESDHILFQIGVNYRLLALPAHSASAHSLFSHCQTGAMAPYSINAKTNVFGSALDLNSSGTCGIYGGMWWCGHKRIDAWHQDTRNICSGQHCCCC